jgi:hypothetical protein
VTQAETLFDACRKGLDWFNDLFWKGPVPEDDTILDV